MIRESWQSGEHTYTHAVCNERKREKKSWERPGNSGKEIENQSPRSVDYIEGRRVTFLLVDFCENRAMAFTR